MNRKKLFLFSIIIITVLALGIILRDVFMLPGADRAHERDKRGVVGLVYVEGPILGGRSQGGFLAAAPGMDNVLKQLREARVDPSVKAVVIRVNSPGGSAAASQEIHNEIGKLREEGKKVVISMSDVAASGGYYISVAADKIMANPGTTTGSIGVIMQVTNLEELYEKIGVDFESIKSGEHKDLANPARTMTDEEREVLQSMTNDIYEQFVEAVSQGRGMSEEEVLEVADGRILTGRQAQELGLVDKLGDLYDAVDLAAKLAEIDDPAIVEFGKVSPWNFLLGGGINDAGTVPNLLEDVNLYRLIRGVEIK